MGFSAVRREVLFMTIYTLLRSVVRLAPAGRGKGKLTRVCDDSLSVTQKFLFCFLALLG